MGKTVDIERLSEQLQSIVLRARELETEYSDELAAVHPAFRDSARNLVHYVALRQSDISELQEELAALGLSSLGRAERNVMGSVQAVRSALQRLTSDTGYDPDLFRSELELENPAALEHKKAILGEHPEGRDVNIMVTLPTDAASNPTLVEEMIAAGMNIARINCAHDRATSWEAMVANVRAASEKAGADCRVLMDLAGPKLRTGALQPGPRVLHVRPKRDALGRLIAPRRIRFMPDDMLQRGSKAAVVPVPREFVEFAEPGDDVRIRDSRGKKRRLSVVGKDDRGLILEAYKGAYIASDTRLRLVRIRTGETLTFRVGELPAVEQALLLQVGDTLVLHSSNTLGTPAREDASGKVTEPAHVACQQPEVFAFVNAGDPISLNDGKISGVVSRVSEEQLEIEITKAKPTGSKLRGNRGINFPKSNIRLPGLTATDRGNLEFVVEHADAVSLSFVKEPQDIRLLQDELGRYPDRNPGLVIKIETQQGFRNLPKLLLAAMQSYPTAVMIARGDLAVECGWARLAELQEEILWFCEAARVPVIWATQVLEQETKKGLPSRAEISDAALSQRADCVMLNKGPHILASIRMLDSILRRMQRHQFKKSARMRRLHFPPTSGTR